MASATTQPDFYLSSREHVGEWAKARSAYVERVGRDKSDVTHLWIRVSPGVEHNGRTVERVVLAAHFAGSSIWPNPRFPCPVYVYVPKAGETPATEPFDPAHFELAAWGELYETSRDAQRASEDHVDG